MIGFLADPATHGGANPVERFETHGNVVFLAGSEAWKIKRAVRFPYMDFSTLEKRKAACLREVEINRRLAPDLYLNAVPIARFPGAGGLPAETGDRGLCTCAGSTGATTNVAVSSGIGPDLAESGGCRMTTRRPIALLPPQHGSS